jgi:hypothetical protein
VIDFINEIAVFVTYRRKDSNAERIVYYYRNFFNICIHIKFKDTDLDVIIRFAKTDITVFKDEKIKKEVKL